MEPYIHKTQYYETDQMGLIHHSNYIRWFEEARVDFLEQLGYPYQRLEEEGILSPVLGITCDYRSMIRFGDRVEIHLELKSCTPYKFTIGYRFIDAESGELKAVGESRHCYIDREGKPLSAQKVHPEFYEAFRHWTEDPK